MLGLNLLHNRLSDCRNHWFSSLAEPLKKGGMRFVDTEGQIMQPSRRTNSRVILPLFLQEGILVSLVLMQYMQEQETLCSEGGAIEEKVLHTQ
jgi:hypothetical protein